MTTVTTMKARWVDALQPPATGTATYRDAVARGLELNVSTRGRKTWIFRYTATVNGTRRFPEVPLGTYPTVTLAEARALVGKGQAARQAGQDPVAAMGLTATAAPPSARPPVPPPPTGEVILPATRRALGFTDDVVIRPNSFGHLAANYYDHHAVPDLEYPAAEARNIKNYLLPWWRDLDLTELRRKVIHERIDAIAARGSESPYMQALRAIGKGTPPKPAPIMANRISRLVSRMLSHAVEKGWIENHSATRLKQRTERVGTRVLERDDILALWTACERDEDPICAAALLLELFTGQRTSIVLHAEWKEFDVETAWWTVPEDRVGNMKNRRVHRVPLGAYALQLLAELQAADYHAEFLFPHRGVGGWKKPGFFELLYALMAEAGRPLHSRALATLMHARGIALPAKRADLQQRIACELSRRARQDDPFVTRLAEGWLLTATPLKPVFGDGPLTKNTKCWSQFVARVCHRLSCTPRDLRRTMDTHMARLGVADEHLTHVLGQTVAGVNAKHYNKYKYDAEKRAAMTKWHDELRAWRTGPIHSDRQPRVVRFTPRSA